MEVELLDAVDRERARAERLVRLDSLKNAVLSTLSRDLRAPLTAILAAASALQRPDLELERRDAHELLAQMTTRARRMERLLNDLVDLDRLGRGILEADRFPVDIGTLAAKAVERCELSEGRRIEVDDDGPGVPDARKASLFDGFHRPLNADTDTSGAGGGIGLALVARFAELHGGRAWVEDRPGGGSAFRIFLPDAPASQR